MQNNEPPSQASTALLHYHAPLSLYFPAFLLEICATAEMILKLTDVICVVVEIVETSFPHRGE